MKLKSFLYTTTALSLLLGGQAMGSLTRDEMNEWESISDAQKKVLLQNRSLLTDLSKAEAELTAKFSEHQKALEDDFKAKKKQVDEEKKTFEESLTKKVKAAEEEVRKKVNPKAKDGADAIDLIQKDLGGSEASLIENLTLCRETVEDSPTNPLYDQLTMISALVDKSSDPLGTKINDIAVKLDGSKKTLAEKVEDVIVVVDSSSKNPLKETLEAVSEQISTSKDSLAKKVNDVIALVDKSTDPLSTRITNVSGRLDDTSNPLAQKVDEASEALVASKYTAKKDNFKTSPKVDTVKEKIDVVSNFIDGRNTTSLLEKVENLSTYLATEDVYKALIAGIHSRSPDLLKEDTSAGTPEITTLDPYHLTGGVENLLRLQYRILRNLTEKWAQDNTWKSTNKKVIEDFKKTKEGDITLYHLITYMSQLKF